MFEQKIKKEALPDQKDRKTLIREGLEVLMDSCLNESGGRERLSAKRDIERIQDVIGRCIHDEKLDEQRHNAEFDRLELAIEKNNDVELADLVEKYLAKLIAGEDLANAKELSSALRVPEVIKNVINLDVEDLYKRWQKTSEAEKRIDLLDGSDYSANFKYNRDYDDKYLRADNGEISSKFAEMKSFYRAYRIRKLLDDKKKLKTGEAWEGSLAWLNNSNNSFDIKKYGPNLFERLRKKALEEVEKLKTGNQNNAYLSERIGKFVELGLLSVEDDRELIELIKNKASEEAVAGAWNEISDWTPKSKRKIDLAEYDGVTREQLRRKALEDVEKLRIRQASSEQISERVEKYIALGLMDYEKDEQLIDELTK